MKTYVIKAPEGLEAVETVVDGVINISFIPKVLGKKLPTTIEETEEFMPKRCFCIGSCRIIERDKNHVNVLDANVLTSKEYAEAFLAPMQLIRFRDIWNEGWIADWTNVEVTKYVIRYDSSSIVSTWRTTLSSPLVFKTIELRAKFLETFKDLIETAKPLL